MSNYTMEELEETLQIVNSAIIRCEKIMYKFKEGSSHYTLLKNRLKALYISKSLIIKENIKGKFTVEELITALKPISSIISKCEKAQLKFSEGSSYHSRFNNMIKAMYISKSLINYEINIRG